MKKVLVLVSIVMLVFCFFSCKTTEEATTEPAPVAEAPAVEAAPEAAPAPEAPAEPVALSEFPAGKWLDANWNALWTFYADGSVKLYDSVSGDLIYDFNGQIKDYKLEPAGLGLKASFRCDETQRFYVFEKGIEGTDLNMDIDRDWTDEAYNIDMPFQN